MYRDDLREEISQGDVFLNLPLSDYTFGDGATATFGTPRIGPIVLLSNDCDYDHRRFIMVAELLVLQKSVKLADMDTIRNNQSRRPFYYSPLEDVLPESCVDFCRIHRIDKRFIVDCADIYPRLVSLTDEARSSLRMRIAIFFGLPEPIASP